MLISNIIDGVREFLLEMLWFRYDNVDLIGIIDFLLRILDDIWIFGFLKLIFDLLFMYIKEICFLNFIVYFFNILNKLV